MSIRVHMTHRARIQDPQWAIIGAEYHKGGYHGFMVLASKELSQAELYGQVLRIRPDILDPYDMRPVADEEPPKVMADFTAKMGNYVIFVGKSYEAALAALFREWNPAIPAAPAAAIERGTTE